MAKTQTKLTEDQVNEHFAFLERAAADFQDAILNFKKQYNPDTVGLNDWAESIDEVMFDIDQDIQSTFYGE
jgi:hypothetical protein